MNFTVSLTNLHLDDSLYDNTRRRLWDWVEIGGFVAVSLNYFLLFLELNPNKGRIQEGS